MKIVDEYVSINQLRTSLLDVRGFVHHSTVHKENPTRCNSVSDFIIP
jgi:hypothetical protein